MCDSASKYGRKMCGEGCGFNYKTMTFGEIVRRFDVLYNNNLSFEEKLMCIYRFDRSTFPEYYPEDMEYRRCKTLTDISRTEPVMKFPYDENYMPVLAEYLYFVTGDIDRALQQINLRVDAVMKYRSKYAIHNKEEENERISES